MTKHLVKGLLVLRARRDERVTNRRVRKEVENRIKRFPGADPSCSSLH